LKSKPLLDALELKSRSNNIACHADASVFFTLPFYKLSIERLCLLPSYVWAPLIIRNFYHLLRIVLARVCWFTSRNTSSKQLNQETLIVLLAEQSVL